MKMGLNVEDFVLQPGEKNKRKKNGIEIDEEG